jgi:DNA modification methylase
VSVELLHGDCVDLMRAMPENSVDSIVTDPPYELSFMGKAWDGAGIAYSLVMWGEALRVLKPGGHLLAFGGTRTYHRMACAIEDAGFEIRDSIHWVYGSGFPKSLNIGKAIDKAAGAEREVLRERTYELTDGGGYWGNLNTSRPRSESAEITAPATEDARRWEGWGTGLKPAHEPVVVARKPLSGTVAGNVLVWGTGGLNIDGCRVGTDGGGTNCGNRDADGRCLGHDNAGRSTSGETVHGANGASGRWPANIVLDGAAAAALDQQNEGADRYFTQADFGPDDWPFVYQAKPSKRERNAGLDGLPEREWRGNYGDGIQDNRPHTPEGYKYESTTRNHHPTVKPVALMRHLVRLVSPPGGTVLDPFAGSGTTLVAAVLEGFDAIGCEMTDEYLPIIRGRVAWAEEQRDSEQPTLL